MIKYKPNDALIEIIKSTLLDDAKQSMFGILHVWNTYRLPKKLMLMVQHFLYLHAEFIPTSNVQMAEETNITNQLRCTSKSFSSLSSSSLDTEYLAVYTTKPKLVFVQINRVGLLIIPYQIHNQQP